MPNIPHHLIRPVGPATLDPATAAEAETIRPEPEALQTDESIQESDRVAPSDAPRVDRTFARAATARRAPAVAAAERTAAADAARRSFTDYGYVIGELKRIFITAAIVVLALIVIALIHR